MDRKANAPATEMAEAQLAAIVASSDDAIFSKDLDGIILTWNRAAEHLYGYTAQEIIGQSVAILMPPEKPDEFVTIMERLKRGERIDHYDTVRIHRDGHRIEVSVSISPLPDAEGHLMGASSIAREIGERKRLEAERRAATDRVMRLQRVTAALSEALTPDQVGGVVVDQAVEALGAWAGLVGVAEENDAFCILNAKGYAPKSLKRWRCFPLSGPYPVSDAIRSGQPIWIESHAEYQERYPAMADAVATATDSAAIIPLRVHRRAIGALVLSFPEARRFPPEERAFAHALSYQCAQALERSRLYAAERQAREEAEDARRRSAFLAEASAILSASLDSETTLANVARSVVPDLADWCVVHLREGARTLKPVALSHADPHKVAWAHTVQERCPTILEDSRVLGLVLRTGKPVIYNNITDRSLARTVRDAEHLRILRAVGLSSVMMAPLVARGRTLGVLTFIRSQRGHDYTPADQELAGDLARRCALAVDNARLYHESQELIRAKEEFEAMLAHELRNPIGALSNALYLLNRVASADPEASRALDVANRQLRHVTRLLDDLLDVSRITRGKVRLRLAPVDLTSVVEGAIVAQQQAIAQRGHHLQANLPDEALWVLGDADRLEQVIRNLLDNAAKYTPDGGHIEVSLERAGDQALLCVRDNGAGIPPELLPRIFDLFTQADRSLDRSEGGLGIGLTLVKSLVEMHNGTVEVVSAGPGKGSEFLVRLPLDASPAGAPRAGVAHGGGNAGSQPDATEAPPALDVLVVEDNPDAAQTLSDILEMWGNTVRVAADGPTALRLFEEGRSDVVLLDIGLPDMSGLEVGRRLRAMEGGDRVLLVAVSGYSRPEDQAQSRAAGFDHHLSKPVDPSTLRALLTESASGGRGGNDAG